MLSHKIYSNNIYILFALVFSLGLQRIAAQEFPEIDTKAKQEVIEKVADYMKDHYVYPDVGIDMATHIRTKLNNGDYEENTNVRDFCKKVTTHLREISHDKHIFVFYSPEEAREVAARNGLLPPEEVEKINKSYFEADKKDNFGFSEIEIMKGNIGYLRLDYFSEFDDAVETTAAAMKSLSGADAIIIDLRNNGGGAGDLVSFLASYFFDSTQVPLTGGYFRSTGEIQESWTKSTVPGEKMPDIDLYILTNSRTFSAAEDFCYSLKHLKRATVIGERTKGGAHPVDVMIVKGNILTQISIGYSINPITKTNWEGVGVEPDVEVKSEAALSTAHLLALKSSLKKTDNADLKNELIQLINQIEVEGHEGN